MRWAAADAVGETFSDEGWDFVASIDEIGFSDPPLLSSTQDTSERLAQLIAEHQLLSAEALVRAQLVGQESGERLDAVITRLGLVSEAALAQMLAQVTGCPLLSPAQFPTEPVGAQPLSAQFLRDARMVPVTVRDNRLVIAQANPLDGFSRDAMRFVFGRPVDVAVALPSDIDAAIERLYGHSSAEQEEDSSLDGDDLERMKDLVSDAPVIRAVNRLIAEAVDAHASDIHIEPTDDRLSIRYRIDGVLQDRPALPAAMRAPLVSRIKVMASLNIAERRLPQDGRLRLAVRGHEIDLRVATAPSIHGESVVLRVLDRSNLSLDFATLGFTPELAENFRRALHRPHGIVLVTGPTGSGKTTTLYAALAELNERGRKLLTVEDPIEYRLPGVIQTQVNPGIGFTFSSALRSFLRQDPDVMMVGRNPRWRNGPDCGAGGFDRPCHSLHASHQHRRGRCRSPAGYGGRAIPAQFRAEWRAGAAAGAAPVRSVPCAFEDRSRSCDRTGRGTKYTPTSPAISWRRVRKMWRQRI